MHSSILKTLILPVLITLSGFFLAWQFVDPAPPAQITFTTGSTEGAYHRYAQQYHTFLAKYGINLHLKNSQGSAENIDRLQSAKAMVGFVQGGVATQQQGKNLYTLGSLYYEPLWVFHRKSEPFKQLNDLRGRKLMIGAEGSGTRSMVMQLLKINRIENEVILVDSQVNEFDGLKSGDIDAVFVVASATSAVVRQFLQSDDVDVMSFERAEAYERHLKFLTHVTLPAGVVDLAQNIPAADKVLLATTASLVVNEDLHPAVQDLLLQAADHIHGQGGWFEDSGEFPRAEFTEFTVSPEAKRFYKYGPPLLQRFLPFRVASLLDRLKVMILPLIVLMIPLMKIMPPIYTWRMRSKIYRWYQSLEKIDLAMADGSKSDDVLRDELDTIDREVVQVHVPLSFANQLYDLRQHIELVKRRLD